MTYDLTAGTGTAIADREYFLRMKEIQDRRAGKAASQKVGISSAKLLKALQDYTSPAKLQAGGESIFKGGATPTGNIFERIGQSLTGPDLSKLELTEAAKKAKYKLIKGTTKDVLKPDLIAKTTSTPLVGEGTRRALKEGGGRIGGPKALMGDVGSRKINLPFKLTKGVEGAVNLKGAKTITTPTTLTKDGEVVSKQFEAGGGLSSLLGAYQMGTGLSTVFDPHASTTRKVAGGVNAALGANALLAYSGANIWNPTGAGALILGGGATIADMFFS